MRTKNLAAATALLAFGLGSVPRASAQLLLRGADELDGIVTEAVSTCAGGSISSGIVYVGGSSTSGQAALLSVPPGQQIAPMTRQLNGGACTPEAEQQVIGLEAVVLLAANQSGGDSLGETTSTADDCNDNVGASASGSLTLSVPGCTRADGCDDDAGSYKLGGASPAEAWKDVLALLFGGQNHSSAAQTLPPTTALCLTDAHCPSPQVCVGSATSPTHTFRCGGRNARRIDCNGKIRRHLVNNWGHLFNDVTGGARCRTGSCTRLKHAFRHDDRSGVTASFVALLGLPPVPPFTARFDSDLPLLDGNADVNPFCNAGSSAMNRGDADYLDLDPIRRAVDHDASDVTNRPALELIGQASLPAFGGNNDDANCEPADGDTTRPGIQPKLPPTDSAASTEPGILPAPWISNSEAKLRAELGFNHISFGNGSAITAPTTRVCLGLLLPISIPGNFTSQDAYFGADAVTPPTPCTVTGGVRDMRYAIPDVMHSASALCPDGKRQPCRLPVSMATGTPNFNCYVEQTAPQLLPVRDNRAFNLHPLQANGQYRRDDYLNPNIPTSSLSAVRQNRVPTAFWRLHATKATRLQGTPTLAAGGTCRQLSPAKQIGCLVKASPCSVGASARSAVDALSLADNFAVRLDGLPPSIPNLASFVETPTYPADDYPMTGALWVNAIKPLASVTGPEGTLTGCFRDPAFIDPIVERHGLVPVSASIKYRTRTCPNLPITDVGGTFNTCPVLSELSASSLEASGNETIDISVTATDPDPNDPLTLTWSGALPGQLGDPHAATTTFSCDGWIGSFSLSVSVTDSRGCRDWLPYAIPITCVRPTVGLGTPVECPNHESASCQDCTNQHCGGPDTRCCSAGSFSEMLACDELLQCVSDNAASCGQGGDPTQCYCGGAPGCFQPFSTARGPCVDQFVFASQSTDPAAIIERFTNPAYPLGRAVNRFACQAAHCSAACGL